MSEQEPQTFTQEQVNSLLAEQKRKITERFSDYDEIKAKAAQVDTLKAESDAAIAAAVTRAEAAEGQVQQFQTEKQVETWKTEVAKATGVPATALRGSTKEDFEAHAAELKPLITGAGPVIPSQGDSPTKQASVSPWSGVLQSLDQQRDA